MVDIVSGDVKDQVAEPEVSALARKGGLKGGKARAAALTPEQRSEIARAAAAARWKKTGALFAMRGVGRKCPATMKLAHYPALKVQSLLASS